MPNYGFSALAPAIGLKATLDEAVKQRMLERKMALEEQQTRQQAEQIAAQERMRTATTDQTRAYQSEMAQNRADAIRNQRDASKQAAFKTFVENQPEGGVVPPEFEGTYPVRPETRSEGFDATPGTRGVTVPKFRAFGAMPQKPEAGVKSPAALDQEKDLIRFRAQVGAQYRPAAQGAGTNEPPTPDTAIDPESRNILAQTGLNMNAFYWATGQGTKLSRDAATRKAAARDAEAWSRAHNVDVSTLPSQFKTYNDVLGSNISRLNNTKIMEQELQGTIQNLQGVVRDQDLGKLRFANVAKIWAGQEVNDDLAQQYALHLGQLRNELAAYYAATQGRSGNNIMLSDERDAERVIRNGISQGSLDGLEKAITNSTAKMGAVMSGSVDRSRKAIWDLFGVGQNYKNTAEGAAVGSSGPKVIRYDINGNVIK